MTQRYFSGPGYVETDIDIGSSLVASNITSLCRSYASQFSVKLGIVLQGQTDDELPERLLGYIYANKVDLELRYPLD